MTYGYGGISVPVKVQPAQPGGSMSTYGGMNAGLLQQATQNPQKPGSQPVTTTSATGFTPAQAKAALAQFKKGQSQGYDAAEMTASTYSADKLADPTRALVSNQLDSLLASDSPYIKRAETKALQQANQRGLLNSSFAVGAATGAAIDRALPIAQQDASTVDLRERTNMAAENQARQFNAGNEQDASMRNQSATNTARQFNAGNAQQMEMANMQAENATHQFNASNQQQMNLANMDAQNQAAQFNASSQNTVSLANMDAQNRMALAELEKDTQIWSQESRQNHDQLMSQMDYWKQIGVLDAEAYANVMGKYVDSIDKIRNNALINISEIQKATDIPSAEKTKMIDQQIKIRDQDLLAMQGLYQALPMWRKNWTAV